MKLNPQHLPLAELFARRLFRIPEYQRPYAWENAQRDDLFNDIEGVRKASQDHFMATVVTLRRDTRRIGADEFTVVDIVDGQQRLTTLIVLFKAIELLLDESTPGFEKVRREINELLVKDDEHSLVLLQTNHDTTTVMSDYLRSGTIPDRKGETQAEQNLIDAIRQCHSFVARWRSSHGLVELVAILRNRLSVLYHELDQEATVYRVFEVLNSRGLDVKWIDKLKSQLMASVFAHADETGRAEALNEMHTQWQAIYRKLGLSLNIGDEALRFAGTWVLGAQPNRVLNQKNAATVLHDKAGTQLKSIMETVKWLSRVVDVIHEIDSDPRLYAVARIGHARFLAASILLRKFPKQTEIDLLQRWERVTFRIFGLEVKDSRYKVGDYVRLAYRVFADKIEADEIAEGIRELGVGFDITTILKKMDWRNSYEGWADSLRYLLFRYEEHLAAEAGESINTLTWAKIWREEPSRSIEHIQPQSSRSRYVHHLGNLTMLPPGVNSALQDLPPAKKAERYLAEGIRATIAVGQSIKRNGWNEAEAKKRAQKIEKFVRKEWAD